MKIELNIKLDKEVYLDFHELAVGGVDFGNKIQRDHPMITKDNHSKYIDDFYSAHATELTGILTETVRCFDDVKGVLFTELRKYFGRDYSHEDYKCYLSIFDCNPRYIETKSFQVYYKRPYDLRKEVIVHELTHFAFYDFCNSIGIQDNKALWELSEIFNVIFLNLPPIREAVGAEELLFYPELKVKLERAKKVWEKELSAEEFISTSLQIISNY
ncbi:MAG: hypothetical protein WCK03_01255 [Candidatus Taylorbacteria bacterium]